MKVLLLALALYVPTAHGALKEVCCVDEISPTELLKEPVCLGIIGGAGVLSLAAAPVALATAGFGSVGIAGGSIAAWWQSTGIMAGAFAGLQSAGMAGLALTTKAAIASTAGATAVKLCCATVTCPKTLAW